MKCNIEFFFVPHEFIGNLIKLDNIVLYLFFNILLSRNRSV